MASNVNLPAIEDSITSTGLDLNGGDDIRVGLLMSNTTADTEDNVADVDAYTTDDVMDGANYALKTLASEAVAIDAGNNRVEFDFENLTWTALGNGTRAVQGILIVKFVSTFGASLPIAFIEFSSNQNPGGSDFTVTVGAEGAIHFEQGA